MFLIQKLNLHYYNIIFTKLLSVIKEFIEKRFELKNVTEIFKLIYPVFIAFSLKSYSCIILNPLNFLVLFFNIIYFYIKNNYTLDFSLYQLWHIHPNFIPFVFATLGWAFLQIVNIPQSYNISSSIFSLFQIFFSLICAFNRSWLVLN